VELAGERKDSHSGNRSFELAIIRLEADQNLQACKAPKKIVKSSWHEKVVSNRPVKQAKGEETQMNLKSQRNDWGKIPQKSQLDSLVPT